MSSVTAPLVPIASVPLQISDVRPPTRTIAEYAILQSLHGISHPEFVVGVFKFCAAGSAHELFTWSAAQRPMLSMMVDEVSSTRPPRPVGLPDFETPPIDEVAIGITFRSLAQIHHAVLSAFRESVKEVFPNTEYQPRLPSTPIVQVQPVPQGSMLPPFPLAAPAQEALDRVWFVTNDNSRVLQLQDDRFVFNWRKRAGEYPHFEAIEEEFWRYFSEYRSVVGNLDSLIDLQQIEVSYFNWIEADTLSQEDAIRTAAGARIQIPDFSLAFSGQIAWGNYAILNGEVPIGRLMVHTSGQVVRVSREAASLQRGSILNLSYFATLPPGVDDASLGDTLHKARQVIVQSFDQLTTPEGHTAWHKTS